MRLLHFNNDGEFSLTQFFDDIPPYAILSHTWGLEEVTFKDMMEGDGKSKAGFDKIRFCGERARCDGLQYFWVDACCIDKSSSAELTEAINSMFRWYQDAAKCYVYMSDVSVSGSIGDDEFSRRWKPVFKRSRWFTRGWTLQELIAPKSVEFFSKEEQRLGDKQSLEQTLHEITGIAIQALRGSALSHFSVDERMSWAAKRQTRREEDNAYSLLGIFNLYMPLIYGEGRENALIRLRKHIRESLEDKLLPLDENRQRMLLDSLKFDQHHEILKWLEHTNPSRNHNRAHELHEEHTGVWTLRSQEWKDWLERRTRCLWIHGIPGAGKTVLASYLIEQLKAKFMDTSGVGYAYYYCYFARKQDEAGPFLRWVISQLCRRARRVPSRLVSLHQQGCEPGFPELLACLEASLEVFDVAYITVDAVDESMPYRSLLNILRTLGSDDRFRKIQLLVTSREYLDIERILLDFAVPMAMSNSLVDQDIQHYVRSELASNRKFSAWPESARTEIEEALTKGAKGMFRWVICQLDILERLKTPSAVTRALHDLPETLDETYERILSSIPTQHRRFARRAFAILCAHADVHISDEDPICAEVLLSAIVSGMREETGNGHFYVCDTIREVCGCLVSITQDPLGGKEVALLAHYTVKEFLYSERIFNSRVDGVDFFALNDRIVRTEFAEMVFKGATEAEESQETGQPDIFSDFQDYCLAYGAIIIRKWDLLLTRCSSLYELAFRFLSPSQSHFTRLLRIEATISDAISDDEFEPLVLQWESVANNESMILGNLLWYHAWNLAETFVVEKDLKSIPFEHLSCAEYRCAGQANTHGSLLTILARLGNHYSILPFLKLVDILYRKLDKSTLLLCCTAIHYHNDCHRSSEYGCILEWLIDHGADPNSTLFGLTPLQIAIARLDYEGAKLLLTEGANPNAIGTPAGLMPSGIHTIKTNASPLHIIRSGAYEVEAIDDFVDLHSPYTTEPKATVEELLLGFGARDFVRPTQMMMEFLLGPGP